MKPKPGWYDLRLRIYLTEEILETLPEEGAITLQWLGELLHRPYQFEGFTIKPEDGNLGEAKC